MKKEAVLLFIFFIVIFLCYQANAGYNSVYNKEGLKIIDCGEGISSQNLDFDNYGCVYRFFKGEDLRLSVNKNDPEGYYVKEYFLDNRYVFLDVNNPNRNVFYYDYGSVKKDKTKEYTFIKNGDDFQNKIGGLVTPPIKVMRDVDYSLTLQQAAAIGIDKTYSHDPNYFTTSLTLNGETSNIDYDSEKYIKKIYNDFGEINFDRDSEGYNLVWSGNNYNQFTLVDGAKNVCNRDGCVPIIEQRTPDGRLLEDDIAYYYWNEYKQLEHIKLKVKDRDIYLYYSGTESYELPIRAEFFKATTLLRKEEYKRDNLGNAVYVKSTSYVNNINNAPVDVQEFYMVPGIDGQYFYKEDLLNYGGTLYSSGCGNDVIDGTEQCDDGNSIDGDGCSSCVRDNICADAGYSTFDYSRVFDLENIEDAENKLNDNIDSFKTETGFNTFRDDDSGWVLPLINLENGMVCQRNVDLAVISSVYPESDKCGIKEIRSIQVNAEDLNSATIIAASEIASKKIDFVCPKECEVSVGIGLSKSFTGSSGKSYSFQYSLECIKIKGDNWKMELYANGVKSYDELVGGVA